MRNRTSMKHIIFFFVTLIAGIAANANPGPVPGANSTNSTKALVNAGAVRFQFNKIVTTTEHTDSVLVIFDRFDHTGAGVIYQMYAADNAQGIDISDVPAGKYYVTIQFVGLHRDQIEKVITIKAKKNESVRIALEDTEVFSKDHVVIPAYRPDFSDLSVRK
jgi:hypothetical protein